MERATEFFFQIYRNFCYGRAAPSHTLTHNKYTKQCYRFLFSLLKEFCEKYHYGALALITSISFALSCSLIRESTLISLRLCGKLDTTK